MGHPLLWDVHLNTQKFCLTQGVNSTFEDRDSGIVISSEGSIIKTTDGGSSWRTLLPNIGYSLSRIASPRPNSYVAVGAFQHVGVIIRTSDGGFNWGGGAGYLRYLEDVCFADSVNGIAVGYSGIVRQTTDGGNTWIDIPTDTLFYLFGVKITRPERAIAVGLSGTIVHIMYSGISDVYQENDANKPLSFSLSQNYPNPFNPATRIQYGVKSEAYVDLRVYDVLGRDVANLVNELKIPGTYEIEWDASKLASGVYYYRLRSSFFADVKKMILLR